MSATVGPTEVDVNKDLKNENSKYIVGGVAVIAVVISYIISSGHLSNININDIMLNSVKKIESLGPYGFLYFSAIYIAAEILAFPAIGLTASSGYLFGLVPGVCVCIVSATIASSIAFFIGRTLLRNWAKKMADGNAKWRALDSVIGKEGFKVVLLLRLSPLLPFAISNYLYGVTAVDYWSYLAASFLGFIPGTVGIVYAGSAGKELLSGGQHLPWFAYVAAAGVIALVVKYVGKVATDAIAAMEEEDAKDKAKDIAEAAMTVSDAKDVPSK